MFGDECFDLTHRGVDESDAGDHDGRNGFVAAGVLSNDVGVGSAVPDVVIDGVDPSLREPRRNIEQKPQPGRQYRSIVTSEPAVTPAAPPPQRGERACSRGCSDASSGNP